MRFIAKTLAVAMVVLAATSAGAVNIFFGAPTATELNPGDVFSITLRMDTEGDTQINAVGVSVFADPSLFAFVSGTSPGQILFNTSTFEGVPRISQPFTLESDPEGLVRAASFVAPTPSGVASSNQLLATLTFEAVGPGTMTIESLLAQGDNIASNSVGLKDIPGAVTFEPSEPITVPEPGQLFMSVVALCAVLLVSTRRVSSVRTLTSVETL
jgi:hypothetical protein